MIPAWCEHDLGIILVCCLYGCGIILHFILSYVMFPFVGSLCLSSKLVASTAVVFFFVARSIKIWAYAFYTEPLMSGSMIPVHVFPYTTALKREPDLWIGVGVILHLSVSVLRNWALSLLRQSATSESCIGNISLFMMIVKKKYIDVTLHGCGSCWALRLESCLHIGRQLVTQGVSLIFVL